MSAKVKLKFVAGPKKGQEFTFIEHDTFLVGRAQDCHICLSRDERVSRHHMLLEINPPDIRLRDLGSMNGTYVNDVKYGGWSEDNENMVSGMQAGAVEVDLCDGDEIRVGKSVLLVSVEIPQKEVKKVFRCQKCGADVSDEVGAGRSGDYICKKCRLELQPGRDDELGVRIQPKGGEIVINLPEGEAEQSITEELGLLDYQEVRKLGEGGMGVVYLVKHKHTGELSALKVMLAQIAVSDKARKQFAREIQTSQGLRHHFVVNFLGYGSHGGIFYFFMEYCDGGCVKDLMAKNNGRLPLDMAIPIMLHSLEGLAYIHAQNLVHRDLKPQNILLKYSGDKMIAKIGDYGLAKNFTEAGWSGFTLTGAFGGSLPYMPREQISQFKYLYPCSDIWSIGATFYHMLTGTYPREQRRGEDMLEVIFNGRIVPIRQRDPSLKKSIAEVIDRALSGDPEQRYQNAGEMLQALKSAL